MHTQAGWDAWTWWCPQINDKDHPDHEEAMNYARTLDRLNRTHLQATGWAYPGVRAKPTYALELLEARVKIKSHASLSDVHPDVEEELVRRWVLS